MTDEKIVKALRCWTGQIVKDEECAECSFGEDCSLGEIVDATEKKINELEAENASIRMQVSENAVAREWIEKTGEVLKLLNEEKIKMLIHQFKCKKCGAQEYIIKEAPNGSNVHNGTTVWKEEELNYVNQHLDQLKEFIHSDAFRNLSLGQQRLLLMKLEDIEYYAAVLIAWRAIGE